MEPNPIQHVLLRPIDATDPLHGALFHLWWHAPIQDDRVVQVWVNDGLHTASLDPLQRELWLVFAPGQPRRVELRLVEPADAFVPSPAGMDGAAAPADIAIVTLLRDPATPIGSQASVAVDSDGPEQAQLFGANTARIGFGSVFGEGGFGIDAATGPGLGRGALGLGPLGSDGEPWRWRRDDLADGPHTLTLQLTDSAGRPVAPAQPHDIEIDRIPPVPTRVAVDAGQVLTWS